MGTVFRQISLLNFTVRSSKRRNSFDTQNLIVKKSFYNHIFVGHVRIGVGKVSYVRYWSRTMANEVYLSFEHAVSVRNCTSAFPLSIGHTAVGDFFTIGNA